MEFLLVGFLPTAVPFTVYAAWAFAHAQSGDWIPKSLSLTWGVLFPWCFVLVAMVEEETGVLRAPRDVPAWGEFVSVFGLSSITAVPLWWSSRSRTVLVGTLIAGAVAGSIACVGELGGWLFAMLVWHVIVAVSLVEWANDCRGSRASDLQLGSLR